MYSSGGVGQRIMTAAMVADGAVAVAMGTGNTFAAMSVYVPSAAVAPGNGGSVDRYTLVGTSCRNVDATL